MLLTTPDAIWTLQRKLYVKAKQQPAYRFHALYDKLYRADILSHAWRLVKANKGSPGIDGTDFAAIENGMGVDGYLSESYRRWPAGRWRMPDAKNIGKPCAGEPHARFDEGGQVKTCPLLYLA